MAKEPKKPTEAELKAWEIPEDRQDKFSMQEGAFVPLGDDMKPISADEAKRRKAAHDQSLGEMAGVKPGGGAPGGIMPESEE